MKESSLVTVMDLTGGCIGTHDDMLLLRGNKVIPDSKTARNPEGLGVPLTEGYWQATEIKRKNGEKVVTNYYRGEYGPGREYTSIESYEAMGKEERTGWKPVFARGRHLADGIDLTIKNNDVDLIIGDLYVDFGTRYRHALDAMLDLEAAGILKYTPRTEPTEKKRREAIRNQLIAYMKPTRYEHNIIFRGEIGRAIYRDLEPRNRIQGDDFRTIYLQGAKRHKGQTELAVKFYDVGHRARTRDGETGQLDDETFKLETTFLRPYFKNKGLEIRDLTDQPEIQEKLLDSLVDTTARVLGYLSGETLDMIAMELTGERAINKREAPRRLAAAMFKRELTLAGRVEALERKVEQHDRDIEQLKRATGLK